MPSFCHRYWEAVLLCCYIADSDWADEKENRQSNTKVLLLAHEMQVGVTARAGKDDGREVERRIGGIRIIRLRIGERGSSTRPEVAQLVGRHSNASAPLSRNRLAVTDLVGLSTEADQV